MKQNLSKGQALTGIKSLDQIQNQNFILLFYSLVVLLFAPINANAAGADFDAFIKTCEAGKHSTCATITDLSKRNNCCLREGIRRNSDEATASNVDNLSDESLKNYNDVRNACVTYGNYECQSVDNNGKRTPLVDEPLRNCCSRVAMKEGNPFAFDANNIANLDNGKSACDNPLAKAGDMGLQVGPICTAAKDHKKAARANTALAVAWLGPLYACITACAAPVTKEIDGDGCQISSVAIGGVDLITVMTVQKEMKVIQGGLAILAGASVASLGIGSGGWGMVTGAGDAISSAVSGGAEVAAGSIQGSGEFYTFGGNSFQDQSGKLVKLADGTKIPEGITSKPLAGKDAFNTKNEELAKNKKEKDAACMAAVFAGAKVVTNAAGAKQNKNREKSLKEEADKLFVKTEGDIREQDSAAQANSRLASNGTGSGVGRRFGANNLGSDGNGDKLPSPFDGCTDPTQVCAVANDPALGPFFNRPGARDEINKILGGDLDDLIQQADASGSTAGDLIGGAMGGGNSQKMAAAKLAFDGIQDRVSARAYGSNKLASSAYSGGGGKGVRGKKSSGNAISRGLSSLFNKAKGLLGGKSAETSFKGLSYDEIFRNRSISLFTRHETRLKSAFKNDSVKNLPWATPYNMTVTEE